MKIYLIVAMSAIIITTSYSCSYQHKEGDDDKKHDNAESQSQHDGSITVSEEDASKFGIEIRPAEARPFNEVIRVSGLIISNSNDQATISAPTSGILTLGKNITIGQPIRSGASIGQISAKGMSGGDSNQAAKVAVATAKKELERLEPLMKEGIVTKREYNAASAAYQSALASYSPSAASGVVRSSIDGVIQQLLVRSGDYVEAGTPIAIAGKNSSLVLQADLPEKYRDKLTSIITANIRTPYSENWINIDSLNGKRSALSPNDQASVPSQTGYLPVSFTIDNDGSLSSGSFVDVSLICRSEETAYSVPNEAISEQQGNYFIYIKTGSHSYEKRKVIPGLSNGIETEVKSGIHEGENIVVKGATIVRLSEQGGNIPQGHSHNH